MTRGQFVTVVIKGDFGKPRPALVVQSDLFAELPAVAVLPVTSHARLDAVLLRIDVAPTPENGLCEASQIAVDKITVVGADKIGAVIGAADDALMRRVDRSLLVFLGLA